MRAKMTKLNQVGELFQLSKLSVLVQSTFR